MSTPRPAQLPLWCTDAPAGAFPGRIAPNTAKLQRGWGNDEAPAAGHANFLEGNKADWLNWLIEHVEGLPFNFETIDTGAGSDLQSIAFLDVDEDREALIVAAGGLSRYTTDGFSFIARDTGDGADSLYSIACAIDNTRTARFMAVGQNGAARLARTSVNRGSSWSDVSPAGNGLLTRVVSLGASVWLAIGNDGGLLRTANNGGAWANPPGFVFHLNAHDIFHSASLGRTLVVGNNGTPDGRCQQSSDQGASWTNLAVPPVSSVLSVATDGSIWVIATSSGMWWADDATFSWSPCSMRGVGDNSGSVPDLVRYDPRGGWIAVKKSVATAVFSSHDGIVWTRRATLQGAYAAKDVAWVNGYWLITRASGRVSRGLTVG